MMKQILLIISLLLCSIPIQGQVLDDRDSVLLRNVPKAIDQLLGDKVKGHNYVVYSVGENTNMKNADDYFHGNIYLILVQQSDDSYDEYYFSGDSCLRSENRKIEPYDIITPKAFNPKTYYRRIKKLDYRTKGYSVTPGMDRPVYFYFCDSLGTISGQLFSHITGYPWPIDRNVHYFIMRKVLDSHQEKQTRIDRENAWLKEMSEKNITYDKRKSRRHKQMAPISSD